ncbi:MAG TPA: hypothetical protein VIY27_05995 [Myxococcota bacterium]
MTTQGPLFTDIQPDGAPGVPSYQGVLFAPNYAGLDAIGSRQFILDTFNRFRIGQTIFLEFEIFLDVVGVTAIQLQPWWLRPQQEFRAVGPTTVPPDYIVGPSGTDGVDAHAFGTPDISLATTHRLWQTDTQQEQLIGAGPPVVPSGKVFANMLDNVWRFQINSALVSVGYSFTKAFHWPAHGYALAFTSALEGAPGQGQPGELTSPAVRLSWKTGATHSISQENVE